MPYIADRRMCLTADKTEIVEETDVRAATLLAGEGCAISDEDAKRYGLTHLPQVPVEAIFVDGRLGDWSDLERRG